MLQGKSLLFILRALAVSAAALGLALGLMAVPAAGQTAPGPERGDDIFCCPDELKAPTPGFSDGNPPGDEEKRLRTTRAALPARPKGKVEIVIDKDRKTLTVYDNNKVFRQFPVAVGKKETPTPVGMWRIKRKARNWGNGFGSRWLGLDVPWGLYGIHGTNKPWSVGTEASGGCIRMFNQDVEQLYDWVQVGTVVRIIGEVFPPLYEQRDKVYKGCKGTVVMLVQQGLIAEGYLKPPVDGNFGPATEDALKRLQKDRGFEVTGQVDVDIWGVLGL